MDLTEVMEYIYNSSTAKEIISGERIVFLINSDKTCGFYKVSKDFVGELDILTEVEEYKTLEEFVAWAKDNPLDFAFITPEEFFKRKRTLLQTAKDNISRLEEKKVVTAGDLKVGDIFYLATLGDIPYQVEEKSIDMVYPTCGGWISTSDKVIKICNAYDIYKNKK
jgi:hypothetical protein